MRTLIIKRWLHGMLEGGLALETRLVRSLILRAGPVLLCYVCFISTTGAQAPADGSRQIVLEEFIRARPAGSTSVSKTSAGNAPSAMPKNPHYRRVTRPLSSSGKAPRLPETEIGITIWRLRPSRPEDEADARLLVMQAEAKTQWTPERIEADTPLKVGDRIRISIEAPRSGYLYVVDRERYADSSLGDAYLIYPTKKTRGGDNRVAPGKLIDIPALEDTPNHFTLVPSPARNDQIGEVLSIILTPQPINGLAITDKPLQIQSAEVLQWERSWGTAFERFELEGGAGLAWTKEEREAAVAKNSRYLTQTEPSPQTVYRMTAKGQRSLLVTIRLNYRNK